MADIEKTIQEILDSMPVGTESGTSVQDLRDAVISLAHAFGSLHISVTTPTVNLVNTPILIAGTSVFGGSRDFTSPTPNRLQYNGTVARWFRVQCCMSEIAASSNQTVNHFIAKNGTPDQSTIIKRKIGTSSDQGAVSFQGLIRLAPGDYVEPWWENITGSINLTGTALNMYVQGMPE